MLELFSYMARTALSHRSTAPTALGVDRTSKRDLPDSERLAYESGHVATGLVS